MAAVTAGGREKCSRVRQEMPMFISKKHISRRAVLQGAGATIALPLLDAMIPAGTALAQTAASRRRAWASSISRTAP